MSDPARYRRNDQVLWRRTGDGAILAHPGEDGFERLSPTGAAVWELLGSPTTVSSVVAELAEVFEAPRATIESDVTEIIEQYVGRGLVEAEAVEADV
jgi:coenzyme PQQ synthesis protein D (PqqD)